MFFVGDPSNISIATVPTARFVGLNDLLRAASMATTACNDAMRPDVVDYEMYRTGKYIPGTVGATFAFLDKIISSFGATIVGLSVSAIGYVAAQPQPKDPRTPAVFWLSMFLWMGMPILGWACTLIAMKWYPLDKEKMVEIQIKNREVREAAKLAAAANL
jgi:Na+/melibiose symporter-like transporter